MSVVVAYYRTSSATNIDGDSEERQRVAVRRYAKVHRMSLDGEFYDAAVSGADPIDTRAGFKTMLEFIGETGASVILIETASRFARDLAVQLAGHDLLRARGIELIPVDAPNHFTDDTPTAKMVRQILGAVSEFDKSATVLKLKSARDRKSKALGRRCEGRKGYAITHPAMVREAKRLHRRSPKTGKRRSLRKIATELAAMGYSRDGGLPFNATTVRNIVTA
jgi:DNA invertase Pin-like site-specific DNA recombinase